MKNQSDRYKIEFNLRLRLALLRFFQSLCFLSKWSRKFDVVWEGWLLLAELTPCQHLPVLLNFLREIPNARRFDRLPLLIFLSSKFQT